MSSFDKSGLEAVSREKPSANWDNSSHPEFFDYYAEASTTPEAYERFRLIRDAVLRVQKARNGDRQYDVADIGCGAGTQSLVWTEVGHRVCGVDVNSPLLQLARERARQAGVGIDFRLGSATALPLQDCSVDVCMAVELLEHVPDWLGCVREFTRILRPNGVLFLSTSNKLCPIQQEFNLPLYSWYPGPLKRYCERLATTTRPQIANHAKYPAVNWFTYYGLRNVLAARGFRSMDRFDLIDAATKGPVARAILKSARTVPPLRWLGHAATQGTMVLAVKSGTDET